MQDRSPFKDIKRSIDDIMRNGGHRLLSSGGDCMGILCQSKHMGLVESQCNDGNLDIKSGPISSSNDIKTNRCLMGNCAREGVLYCDGGDVIK